jgi:hypothetical protein
VDVSAFICVCQRPIKMGAFSIKALKNCYWPPINADERGFQLNQDWIAQLFHWTLHWKRQPFLCRRKYLRPRHLSTLSENAPPLEGCGTCRDRRQSAAGFRMIGGAHRQKPIRQIRAAGIFP